MVLVGAEVALQATTFEPLDTAAHGQVTGRAGLLLTDEVVIYAAAGYGFELDGPASDILAGGGVEMAVSDLLSLRAEYLRGFASDGLGQPRPVYLRRQFPLLGAPRSAAFVSN